MISIKTTVWEKRLYSLPKGLPEVSKEGFLLLFQKFHRIISLSFIICFILVWHIFEYLYSSTHQLIFFNLSVYCDTLLIAFVCNAKRFLTANAFVFPCDAKSISIAFLLLLLLLVFVSIFWTDWQKLFPMFYMGVINIGLISCALRHMPRDE